MQIVAWEMNRLKILSYFILAMALILATILYCSIMFAILHIIIFNGNNNACSLIPFLLM